MGLTQRLGTIPLAIQTDSSNNVGIGGAANASYKLAVTGTTLTTGAATFSSSVNSGQIQATASGAVIQLIGQVGSNAYYVNDQVNNSGKRWRFGHTGAVSGYNSFDFYNETDDRLVMTLASGGNVGIGTSTPSAKLNVVGNNSVFLIDGGGSSVMYQTFNSSGGNYYIGISSSTGAGLLGGQNAYSMCLVTESARDMSFGTSNTERMRITSGGNVQIGTTSGSVERLRVRGFDSTNGYDCAYFENGGGSKILELRNDGLLSTGTLSYSPYNLSITPGRALYVDSSGTFGYVASVRESKTNINTLGSVDWIKNLNPVSFNYRKKDENNQYTDEFSDDIFYGLIADEVEKIDSNLVFYDVKQNGEKELKGVYYEKLTAVLIKAIQELSAKVTALENK